MRTDLSWRILVVCCLVGLCAASVVWAAGQDIKKEEVPEAVLAAFARYYPFAQAKGFEREEDGGVARFEIEFVIGKLVLEAVFTGDGDLYEVEEVIPLKKVPKEVVQAAQKAHPKAKIAKTEKITRGKDTLYEFYLTVGKDKLEVHFDSAGNPVPAPAAPAQP